MAIIRNNKKNRRQKNKHKKKTIVYHFPQSIPMKTIYIVRQHSKEYLKQRRKYQQERIEQANIYYNNDNAIQMEIEHLTNANVQFNDEIKYLYFDATDGLELGKRMRMEMDTKGILK